MLADITSILESLVRSDLDEAKKRIQDLVPEAKTDRERGELFAASGIYSSLAKSKAGTLQSWDSSRIERAANAISSSELADDFDAGYAEALLAYARITQNSQQSAM